MEWMAWTLPTALFFGAIVLLLAGMTFYELRVPCTERRGFLPIATTRGDRLFIGLLGSAYLHLLGIGVTDWNIWGAVPFSPVSYTQLRAHETGRKLVCRLLLDKKKSLLYLVFIYIY